MPEHHPGSFSFLPSSTLALRGRRILTLGLWAGIAGLGCSGGGSTSGGSGGGSGNGGTLATCPASTRVGGFAVQLIAAAANRGAYTSFGGGVKDAVDPREARQEVAKDGACRLTAAVPLTCTPACTGVQICAGQNQCVNEPTYQDVGTVTLSGLPTAITVAPVANQYYKDLSAVAYPPFAPGAQISLMSAGGKYAAFSLSGAGIAPLEFAGTGLDVARNRALAMTWTPPPASAGAARIFARMDIAHHGGGSARIECDLPDTGSAAIPAGLINQLIDRGTAGFPTLSLTRVVAASTNIAPGCVDLAIASPIERSLTVEGVMSCNCTANDPASPCEADGIPCPVGKTCIPAGMPGGLTCGS